MALIEEDYEDNVEENIEKKIEEEKGKRLYMLIMDYLLWSNATLR